MATTTPNFGWSVPTSTDLVKDGATAIETLGDSIDAAFVDLKGGTSGQVLAKNSGTDLDFIWVAQDDSNAIQNSIVDAKADLITATAADTPARLAVGTNGQVLTADSAESTGLKWATPAGGGKLLQVVTATTTTSATNATTTYADSNLTATITPTLATSKILVMVSQQVEAFRGSFYGAGVTIQLLRGATAIWAPVRPTFFGSFTNSVNGDAEIIGIANMSYLDSPATTSATTYKTQFKADSASTSAKCQNASSLSSIILLEIGA